MQAPAADPLRDLLAYLRDNPDAAYSSAGELADRFHLDHAFVERILAGVSRPSQTKKHLSAREALTGLAKVSTAIGNGLDWFFSHAVLAFVVIFTACIVSLVALSRLLPKDLSPTAISPHSASIMGMIIAVSAVYFLLAMFAFFKTRRPMSAIIATCILEVPLVANAVSIFWITKPLPVPYTKPELFALSLVGDLFMGFVFGGLAILFSIWGQWHWERQQERKISRQDLLHRYHDLTQKLKSAQDLPLRAEDRVGRLVRKHPYLLMYVLSLIVDLLFLVAGIAYGTHPYQPSFNTMAPIPYLVIVMSLSTLSLLIYAAICFIVADAAKAVYVSLGYLAAYFTGLLLSNFVKPVVWNESFIVTTIISSLSYLGLGALIGMAGQLRAETVKRKLLEANDRATVLSELLQIQWRLSERPLQVTLLDVDAVQSSRMKAMSDPLVAEYAFRSYQSWIASIVVKYRGRIHSTAGDGAIVAFADSAGAFAAAQELLQDLPRFNREDNKLEMPFRIRLGLHSGHVVAELEKVEFTEVIDIAAHIQKAAPENGIAMSEMVAHQLGLTIATTLPELIDGQRVYTLTQEPATA